MYAVVQMGSRLRRSASGTNFRVFCASAAPERTTQDAATSDATAAVRKVERQRTEPRLICCSRVGCLERLPTRGGLADPTMGQENTPPETSRHSANLTA